MLVSHGNRHQRRPNGPTQPGLLARPGPAPPPVKYNGWAGEILLVSRASGRFQQAADGADRADLRRSARSAPSAAYGAALARAAVTSQHRRVVSSLAETRRLPSGEKARDQI